MATTQMEELIETKFWLEQITTEQLSEEQWGVVYMLRACFDELERKVTRLEENISILTRATEELAGDVNHWQEEAFSARAQARRYRDQIASRGNHLTGTYTRV